MVPVPCLRRTIFGAVAVGLLSASCGPEDPSYKTHREFLERHQITMQELDQLADRRGIDSLQLGSRFIALNGIVVSAATGSRSDRQRATDSLLELVGIRPAAFDSVNVLMEEAGVCCFYRRSAFTVFVTGGLLDNMNGMLLLHPGGALPPLRSWIVEGGSLVVLVRSEGPWYYFGTS